MFFFCLGIFPLHINVFFYHVDRYYSHTIWNHRKHRRIMKKYHHHNFRSVGLVDPKKYHLNVFWLLVSSIKVINIYNWKVNKIETQLADIGWHHFNLEFADFHVAWHQSRKVGRYEICDIVLDFLVTRCNNWMNGWMKANHNQSNRYKHKYNLYHTFYI